MPPLTLDVLRNIPAEPGNPAVDTLTAPAGNYSELEISGASFTNGHRYLCVVHGSLLGLAGTTRTTISTYFPNSVNFYSPSFYQVHGSMFYPRAKQYFIARMVTANGSAPLKLRIAAQGDDVYLYNPTLWALDLDTDTGLPEFTSPGDWTGSSEFPAISSTTRIGNAWTEVNDFTLNMDGVSDYVVIVTQQMWQQSGFLGGQARMRVRLDGNYTLGQHWETMVTPPTIGQPYVLLSHMSVLPSAGLMDGPVTILPPLSSGNHVISSEVKGDNAWMPYYTQWFFLRLSAFEASVWTYDRNAGIEAQGTEDITDPAGGNELIAGLTNPSWPSWGDDTNPKDKITLFNNQMQAPASVTSPNYGYAYALRDFHEGEGGVEFGIVNQSPTTADGYLGANSASELQAITGSFVDNGITSSPQNSAPKLRVYPEDQFQAAWTDIGSTYVVSFFPTLSPIITYVPGFSPSDTNLELLYAATKIDALDLTNLYAMTGSDTVSLSALYAAARSRLASLNAAIAQILEITASVDVLKADPHQFDMIMQVHLSGSEHIEVLMRVLIALQQTLTATLSFVYSATHQTTSDLSLQISDSAQIVIEADRPVYEALIEIDDLETS